MSKPDNAAAKKTDAVQPDDDEVEQSQGDSVPEEEKSQQDQTDVDDLQNEASAEPEQANDAEVIEADAVITASTSSADDNTTEVGGTYHCFSIITPSVYSFSILAISVSTTNMFLSSL